MLDDPVLGRVSDFEDNEIPQDVVGEESLYIHNQNELLKSIKRRISKYELDFLINEIKDSNIEYWREIIKKLSSYYSLNSLRSFLTPSFTNLDFRKETIRLLYYLKIYLLEKLFENNVNNDSFSNINDFEIFLKEKNIKTVPMFRFTLKYIDRESFQTFISKIISESKSQYSE